jgi:xylan 1,4-beta-xylosidase
MTRFPSPLAACASGALVLALLAASTAGALSPGFRREGVRIDLNARGRPFPHFWERSFGSGRASLSLRESYRRDLRALKQTTGVQYVRFHGIFLDELGVYDEDGKDRPVFNFSYVDQIYDGLLGNGVRPFVELSFMPRKLASSGVTHPFWYKPLTGPPRDWTRWQQLVSRFAQHVIQRYGVDEVARWYFEVWNEPNIDFWSGEPKQESYFRLYDATATALKQVSPRLRVGGPATAQAAWVDRFIDHCVRGRVPVDFVSTHVYANDTARDVLGTEERVSRSQMVHRAVRKVHDQVRRSRLPALPIHFTEYNASYMNEVPVTDSPYMGPWLANTIRQCDGLVDSLDYWAFSDVFEEQGVVKRPFYGGYGLIAAGGIPKAAYNAFLLLHRLGDERIPVDSPVALATRKEDGSAAVAVWNAAPPGEPGTALEVALSLRGIGNRRRVRIQWVDPDRGNALAVWKRMGSPHFPTREQQNVLRGAARLPPPEERELGGGSTAQVSLTLKAHCLALVEVFR